MKTLLMHPVGNQNVRSLINGLSEAGRLHSFHSSLVFREESTLLKIPYIGRELERRKYSIPSDTPSFSHPTVEVPRLIAERLKINWLTQRESIFGLSRLYRNFDRAVANTLLKSKNPPYAVYGYDGKSLLTLKAAKSLKVKAIYEAAFGSASYAKNILLEELDINPAWIESIPNLSEKDISQQAEEMEIADKIVVASNFAKKALLKVGIPSEKIVLAQYGVDFAKRNPKPASKTNTPLKVIYVGALSQQKGISYLFDAIKSVRESFEAHLTIIGTDHSRGKNRKLNQLLTQEEWHPSLPHNKVIDLISSADVLVLPSLSDAFGLVVAEALSVGTPVIVTDHCGSADLIQNGVNGFILPIRRPDLIAERLAALAADRENVIALSQGALKTSYPSWKDFSANAMRAIYGN